MSKYIIFILIFNTFCSVQNFYINKNNVYKPEGSFIFKRQINPFPLEDPNKESIKKDLTQTGINQNQNNNNNNVVTEKEKESLKTKKNGIPDKIDEEKENVENKQYATNNTIKPLSTKNNTSSNHNETIIISKPNKSHNGEIEAKDHQGAILRGFYVFLGLSVIIIIYFLVKAFRLRPGAPPPATVRKYGITGRRSDMEMLPLPLAEEDDDDTVFDMGTQVNRS